VIDFRHNLRNSVVALQPERDRRLIFGVGVLAFCRTANCFEIDDGDLKASRQLHLFSLSLFHTL